jgi:Icc protein
VLIAQIADTHISTPGDRNDRHDRTAEHLERAIAHLNALTPRPDVVLATGDLVERTFTRKTRERRRRARRAWRSPG